MAKYKSGKRGYPNKLSNPLVMLTIIASLVLLVSANIQTTQILPVGTQQSVLGEDEDRDEGTKEENKSGSSKEESKSGRSIEIQSVSPRPTAQATVFSPSPAEIEDADDEDEGEGDENEQETELITADGQKIKTKIENGVTTRIEIRRGELKLKYRLEDGKLVLKVENETGEEVELEDDELNELEDEAENELEQTGVALTPVEGSSIAVSKNQVAAVTDFPLSIDVGTNELILTTPQGFRVVAVLPDQAVQNLLESGIINAVSTQSSDTITQNQLGAFNGVVKLEIRGSDIVYKVNGVRTHRILGFIPVNTNTTAFVSANSGAVVAQERSILANVVDFLSP